MKKGTRLKTPHLSKMFTDEEGYVMERMKNDKKTITEDWENYEDEVCGKCHGTGISSDPNDSHCLACEGTGIWYRLYYGVSDKKPYAYTDEYGISSLKKACKEFRSAHTQMQLAGKTYTNLRPFLLPKTLEMELMARGYNSRTQDPDEKVRIMNVVATEYPDFMCVNYKRF